MVNKTIGASPFTSRHTQSGVDHGLTFHHSLPSPQFRMESRMKRNTNLHASVGTFVLPESALLFL